MTFEPVIVGFLCNWCTFAASDVAGVRRLQYPPNMIPIRIMCTGRIDPEFVLHALKKGADGVLIGGFHLGECHYVSGNYRALRRVKLLKKMLRQMGIDERRVRLEWISAAESVKFQQVVTEFTEEIRKLGPNPLKVRDGDD